jgi:muramoyltetrapeptide carboxypeptidase LdcA involved in peptidoglycan recycling
MQPLTRPPALLPGDTIGICTPSFPAHVAFRAKYLHGVSELDRLGFRVIEGDLTARATAQGARSGTPRERADEINALWANPEVRAIITTIGGANSSSLVPFLDFAAVRANPKIFCGYSDITSLHLAFMRHAGLSTFYGPAVMPSFGEWPEMLPEAAESFLDATMRHLSGPRELVAPSRWSRHMRDARTDAWRIEPRKWEPHAGWRTVTRGVAEGPALVVNLNTLRSNAGTREMPDFHGAILFIEEMSTSPTQAERAFRHLAALGVFGQIAGLVWGRIEHFADEGCPVSIEDLLLEAIRCELGRDPEFPIATDFDCCHTSPMLTIAQGVRVRLDARGEAARVTLLEPAVQPRRRN